MNQPRIGAVSRPRSIAAQNYFRVGKTAIEEIHELIEKDPEAGKNVLLELIAREIGGSVHYPEARQ